jgi:hypothetical protein
MQHGKNIRASTDLAIAFVLASQGGCAGSQRKAEEPLPAAAPVCAPTPIAGLRSPDGSPFKEEVQGQAIRMEPYVDACSRRFPSEPVIVTRWVISGSTGRVTKLDFSSSRGAGTREGPISPELALCIAAAFSGVCFVPFDKDEFHVEYPFKAR